MRREKKQNKHRQIIIETLPSELRRINVRHDADIRATEQELDQNPGNKGYDSVISVRLTGAAN